MANGANISGQARFSGTSFYGKVMLSQAIIGLSLGFEGGSITVHPKADFAVLGNDATVGGGLYFSNGFLAHGTIQMTRTVVSGPVSLIHCDLMRFRMDGAKAHGGFAGWAQVNIRAGLSLAGSEIGGLFKLQNTAIEGGLDCARITCKAGLDLSQDVRCQGEFTLTAGRITGSLNADSVNIMVATDTAVRADGMSVEGNVSFRKAQISGTVRLRNADLAGDLDFSGAKIRVNSGKAMRMTGALVRGGLFLRWGFAADGGIRLSRARINGIVDFERAAIASFDPAILGIEAHGLEVQGALIFRALQQPSGGTVSFNHARVGRLEDDYASWAMFQYRINGFEFKACDQLRWSAHHDFEPFATGKASRSTPPMSLVERINWLRDQPDWNVQPYEHTARIFRAAGYEADAQKILIDKYRQLRKQRRLSRPAAVKNWLLDYLLGYGYRTWRPLIPMVVMLAIGSWIFQKATDAHVLVAKDRDRTEFNRYAYSIDAFVPLVNLKQREAFAYVRPEGTAQGSSVAWFQSYFWLHTALGWILTTLAAAGLSGLVKRE
jgi:hypothetical protein